MRTLLTAALERAVAGRTCEIRRRENDWVFSFGSEDGCRLVTETLWRIIEGGRIALTSEDEGQKFGLPAPLDAQQAGSAHLLGRSVLALHLDPVTADLMIEFEREVRLDVITSSAGYENWQAHFQYNDDQITLIGGGGGALSYVSVAAGSDPSLAVGRPLPAG